MAELPKQDFSVQYILDMAVLWTTIESYKQAFAKQVIPDNMSLDFYVGALVTHSAFGMFLEKNLNLPVYHVNALGKCIHHDAHIIREFYSLMMIRSCYVASLFHPDVQKEFVQKVNEYEEINYGPSEFTQHNDYKN